MKWFFAHTFLSYLWHRNIIVIIVSEDHRQHRVLGPSSSIYHDHAGRGCLGKAGPRWKSSSDQLRLNRVSARIQKSIQRRFRKLLPTRKTLLSVQLSDRELTVHAADHWQTLAIHIRAVLLSVAGHIHTRPIHFPVGHNIIMFTSFLRAGNDTIIIHDIIIITGVRKSRRFFALDYCEWYYNIRVRFTLEDLSLIKKILWDYFAPQYLSRIKLVHIGLTSKISYRKPQRTLLSITWKFENIHLSHNILQSVIFSYNIF